MDFIKGLMSVAFIYTIGWAIYQVGHTRGFEEARCTKRHGYDMERVKAAFLK